MNSNCHEAAISLAKALKEKGLPVSSVGVKNTKSTTFSMLVVYLSQGVTFLEWCSIPEGWEGFQVSVKLLGETKPGTFPIATWSCQLVAANLLT